MEKHSNHKRLGWKTTRHYSAALLVSLTLTACLPPPEPAPLPYRFSIGKFDDIRTAEDTTNPTPFPFEQGTFLQSLRQAMPYTLFGSQDASLNLALTHYEATTFDDSFALSMAFKLEGQDQYGRELAKKPLMCSEVQNRGFELQDYAQQVWNDKNLASLTREARDQKMWQALFDACVRRLATQFGQVLVQQQTAQQRNR